MIWMWLVLAEIFIFPQSQSLPWCFHNLQPGFGRFEALASTAEKAARLPCTPSSLGKLTLTVPVPLQCLVQMQPHGPSRRPQSPRRPLRPSKHGCAGDGWGAWLLAWVRSWGRTVEEKRIV